MRIHFIAVGGAAMHSLAIAMKLKGHNVTGSDDEIFDPAKTQLAKHNLLPDDSGWHPERISTALDVVILGMHAHNDNLELKRALELGVKVYSYPEFLYYETANKTRVVIAGSHGKTTITSMVMHVLRHHSFRFDYMVGSRLEGFDNMVSLSAENPIAIFEGDEYLSSCIDPTPKFHLYQPQIALISGIAWDHINVFPTWEEYVRQFSLFIEKMPDTGYLVYCNEDMALKELGETINPALKKEAYHTPSYYINDGVFCIKHEKEIYPMAIFGKHNMQNIEGARKICKKLGVSDTQFYEAIMHFKGAGKRLQLLGQDESRTIFLDFAHSPSKVDATVNAARELYPQRKLIACLELHTYSSLNKEFLGHYLHTLDKADEAIVFYNPETIVHKRLAMISPDEVMLAFDKNGLKVFTSKDTLEKEIIRNSGGNTVLLLMSSGNFSGIDFQVLTRQVLAQTP
jgi:UDP-N-acetylmuramate: L-alanyl-gamma-D-glutamyl-meso-diaminopimelate ligase